MQKLSKSPCFRKKKNLPECLASFPAGKRCNVQYTVILLCPLQQGEISCSTQTINYNWQLHTIRTGSHNPLKLILCQMPPTSLTANGPNHNSSGKYVKLNESFHFRQRRQGASKSTRDRNWNIGPAQQWQPISNIISSLSGKCQKSQTKHFGFGINAQGYITTGSRRSKQGV